jgi:subfamily B ATP-binding cassette protein MsbA
MNSITTVLQFGWKYLRRYKTRLTASVVFGVIFALLNGSFVWVTKTMAERFDEETPSAVSPAPAREGALTHPPVAAVATAAPLPSGATEANAAGTNLVVGTARSSPGLWDSWKSAYRGVRDSLGQWVDSWLPRVGQPMQRRHYLGLLLFLTLPALLRAATDYLSSYCMGWVSERVVRDIRVDIMDKLQALSLDFFNKASTGDLLTRVNTDSLNLLRSLRQGAADLIKEPLTLLSVFALLCWLDWQLTLAALVLLPLCLYPLIHLGKKAKRATKAGLRANVMQSGQLVELLAGIRVVKAFGLEDEQMARFRKTSGEIVHAGMKGVQAKELVNPVIEIVAVIGLSALLMYVFATGRTGSQLAAFVAGVIFLFQPIKKLAGLHILFEQASVGVGRLREILLEEPTVKEPAQPQKLPEATGDIVFDRVSMKFGERTVLKDFSLTIPRGHKLGLAGESGSGKTTVLNMLFRFYDPTAGSIRIGGVDLRNLSTRDLRQHLALVSQEVVIFDMTVSDNIACGKKSVSREDVFAAARAAFAHEFILERPGGYDGPAGERGATFSGGQRQRLCIARAFVRNAPILVLDEATAALDAKAEAEVQAAIDNLAEHRTVICVAHRLSTLAAMDEIVVLNEGVIVEQGSFQELLLRGGSFAQMAAKQGIRPH